MYRRKCNPIVRALACTLAFNAALLVASVRSAAAQPQNERKLAEQNRASKVATEKTDQGGQTQLVSAEADKYLNLSGKPVVRLSVVVDGAVAPITLSRVTVGTAFSPELGRKGLEELFATGSYADGEVSLAEEGAEGKAGVALTFAMATRRLIRDLQLDFGNAVLDREGFQRDTGLGRDETYIPRDRQLYLNQTVAFFRKAGYPKATADLTVAPAGLRGEPQAGLYAKLIVKVTPGEALRVARRAFDVFQGAADEASAFTASYAVKPGDIAAERNLGRADTELQDALRSKGYFDAVCTHSLEPEGQGVALRVRIALGPRTSVRFEGNDHFDKDALLGALALAEETDRSISQMTDKLRTFYVQRGFLDAEFEVFDSGNEGRLRTVSFRIREQKRVFVRARSYPCFDPDALLGTALALAPKTEAGVGTEIDSFLQEELPGTDFLRSPNTSSFEQAMGSPLTGRRKEPIELNPNVTFSPVAYGRAAEHLQELYRADGYLTATVGPVVVVRERCAKNSKPGECIPVAKAAAASMCVYDPNGTPSPLPPPDATLTCTPDAGKGERCRDSVLVQTPIRLGTRSILYDARVVGARALPSKTILDAAKFSFGAPASKLKLEEVRRTVQGLYEEEGFAFATTKAAFEFSQDHSRVLARIDVSEGEAVRISEIVVRGNTHTEEATIRSRLVFEVGGSFRTSLVRKSQEYVATLGNFSSVSIGLEDPDVPERNKRVIVTVVERDRVAIEPLIEFSTGQGIRVGGQIGFGNLFGKAVNLSLSADVAYLPDFVVAPAIREQYGQLTFGERLSRRVTATLTVPETGLGPTFRGTLDAVYAHDLQRDFYVNKGILTPALAWSPTRELRFVASLSGEYSEPKLFSGTTIEDLCNRQPERRLACNSSLLVPDDPTYVLAQKLTATWDRRDSPLDATRGTLVVLGVEHFNTFVVSGNTKSGDFVKLTQTFAGYFPLYKRLRVALQVRSGVILPLVSDAPTYPDRLFFLGGADSMRAWFASSVVPQDSLDSAAQTGVAAFSGGVLGGNLMVNPRGELRIPIGDPIETVVFVDVGNLWRDYRYPFSQGRFPMRLATGTGLRVQTPVFPIALDFGVDPFPLAIDRKACFLPVAKTCAINFSIGLF
jgi:outer membrane protein insertion porin family